jgi:hypothetical protein
MSNRKLSVKRYIINMHFGKANCIPFVDYLSGRRNGMYSFRLSTTKTTSLLELLTTEALNDFAKKVAKAVDPSENDPVCKEYAFLVRTRIKYKKGIEGYRDLHDVI